MKGTLAQKLATPEGVKAHIIEQGLKIKFVAEKIDVPYKYFYQVLNKEDRKPLTQEMQLKLLNFFKPK